MKTPSSTEPSAFTPGTPWEVIDRSTSSRFTENWREIGPNIVTAAYFDRTSNGERETHCGVRINEANSRLIAAAPDLLAALVAIVEYATPLPAGLLDQARTAIKLALKREALTPPESLS